METTDSIPAPTSIVVMGVSGSGKSTVANELARRLQWEFIEGDDVGLRPAQEHRHAPLAVGVASVWFAHADTSEEVLTERLAQRKGHYMPPSLLRSQLDTLEPLGDDEPGAVVSGEGSVEQTVADFLGELCDERNIQLPS